MRTEEDLRRLALKTGSRLEIGDQVFNADRERVATLPRRDPAPKVEAAPQARDETLGALADMQAVVYELAKAIASGQTVLASTLTEAMLVNAPKARKAVGYKFAVKYNRDGDISEVIATPFEKE